MSIIFMLMIINNYHFFFPRNVGYWWLSGGAGINSFSWFWTITFICIFYIFLFIIESMIKIVLDMYFSHTYHFHFQNRWLLMVIWWCGNQYVKTHRGSVSFLVEKGSNHLDQYPHLSLLASWWSYWSDHINHIDDVDDDDDDDCNDNYNDNNNVDNEGETTTC